MSDSTLLKLGVTGTVVAALCCFTPLAVYILGAIGLSVMTGWLDYVLIPALLLFLAVTIFALIRRKMLSGRS